MSPEKRGPRRRSTRPDRKQQKTKKNRKSDKSQSDTQTTTAETETFKRQRLTSDKIRLMARLKSNLGKRRRFENILQIKLIVLNTQEGVIDLISF